MKNTIVIGSRGSALALWQARFVQKELRRINIRSIIRIIRTQGDDIKHLSFDKLEGKGFFTKELEDALLNGVIDLAVHSHKDLPTESPAGLKIAAVSYREDPGELLLIRKSVVDHSRTFSLRKQAIVGTSSSRRKSQLLAWRPDLRLRDLRGNVPTRVRKLREGRYDAILIANAGVSRLKINVRDFLTIRLDPAQFIPAPAQGVLALQIRSGDHSLNQKLQKLHHAEVAARINLERKILNLLDGGCQLPLGAYVEPIRGKQSRMHVSIADEWNKFPIYYTRDLTTAGYPAKKLVNQLTRFAAKRSQRPSVFISRSEKADDFLGRALKAYGFKVRFQPLIQIKQIPFRHFPKTDWIFFSSKHGVRSFFGQRPKLNRQRFGAISAATAQEILRFGKKADYTGTAGDTLVTALEFRRKANNKTILFPGAETGLRTVQKKFPRRSAIELPVYRTQLQNSLTPQQAKADILVFTSPSNADSFLKKYSVHPDQTVIAMGFATATVLRRNGVRKIHSPGTYSDLGIVQTIISLSI